ncbi:MAG: hypothetical protein NW703_13785 [Nitrospiraceae bacterium]
MTTSGASPAPRGKGSDQPPRVPFWHMRPGPNGGSTIDRDLLDGFVRRVVSGNTAPIWMRRIEGRITGGWFTILPVGWVGEWHESPEPQWVIPLSGRWFLQTRDGKRVEMGPGDIHWGADIDTTGQQGHFSGQIGDEPCVQLLVQFDRDAPDIGAGD